MDRVTTTTLAQTTAPDAAVQFTARPDLWAVLCQPSVRERFLAKVDRSQGSDACHPWLGGANWGGYGVLKVGGYGTTAHRVALALKLGRALLKGEDARHSKSCTTRRCCNAGHLQPGTRADNIRDCIEAGRFPLGPKPARLTEEQAREIRSRYEAGEHAPSLAAAMGISLARVHGVVSGRHWRLPGQPIRVSRPYHRLSTSVSQ